MKHDVSTKPGTEYDGVDATVQATNDSSIVSKASCAALGYFEDAFVQHFAVRGAKGRPIRRAPLIHRGYYVRHLAIAQLQEAFLRSLSSSEPYNVVVLGAGFDTGALRRSWPAGIVAYCEVDFPAVLARKAALLRRADVAPPQFLRSCGADLRDTRAVDEALQAQHLDFQLPTLLIAEVVLAYMEPTEGDAVIAWAASRFPHSLFGIYEQIGPTDSFGLVMLRHFAQRQCPLRSLVARPSLQVQRQRFSAFDRVEAGDMMAVPSIRAVDRVGLSPWQGLQRRARTLRKESLPRWETTKSGLE